MTSKDGELLFELLAQRTNSHALVKAVLEDWPEHAPNLYKNFRSRSPEMLDAGELVASTIVKLVNGAARKYVEDYRWMCEQLRDEELFFHREGRYRLSSFAEAEAEVYSNVERMGRFLNGLLLTQLLWHTHAAMIEMFLSRALGGADKPFDYLEIGPGHGLTLFFAASAPLARHVEGWDVSATALRDASAALERLGAPRPVALTQVDILQAADAGRRYDLVVICEVLEHLERPDRALRFLRSALKDNGRIFITVPLNSPWPDHITLLSTPEDARSLVEANGFRIETMESIATQGRKLERAIADRLPVSVGIVARPV